MNLNQMRDSSPPEMLKMSIFSREVWRIKCKRINDGNTIMRSNDVKGKKKKRKEKKKLHRAYAIRVINAQLRKLRELM